MSALTSNMSRRFLLHDEYADRGAKFGEFGTWEVPLYFSGILEEHEAVRTRAGLFDISHMGEFLFRGPETVPLMKRLLPRDVSGLAPGKALYMPLLNEQGGIIDDILVYRAAADEYLWVVNAGNVQVDEAWVKSHLIPGMEFENLSENHGLFAVQGPASQSIVRDVFGADFTRLGYYRFAMTPDGMISRTGYTGEDGFEIMIRSEKVREVWQRLMEEGENYGLRLIGFGARDTLRLEAGMLLHGHDMNDGINPVAAGIGWAVDREHRDYIGWEAVAEAWEKGPAKKMCGFEMIDRGIPREGYEVLAGGRSIGRVTSGTFSPTLKKNIGLAYVEAGLAEPDTPVVIRIRDRDLQARIVKLPFYRRKRA